jgi:hypothetical protein
MAFASARSGRQHAALHADERREHLAFVADVPEAGAELERVLRTGLGGAGGFGA